MHVNPCISSPRAANKLMVAANKNPRAANKNLRAANKNRRAASNIPGVINEIQVRNREGQNPGKCMHILVKCMQILAVPAQGLPTSSW